MEKALAKIVSLWLWCDYLKDGPTFSGLIITLNLVAQTPEVDFIKAGCTG
jgi:hypothetical protein